jgi:heme-degrading monooxygenase HmoA
MSIVEITVFRLKRGVDAPSFLAIDKRVQTEVMPNQPGFLRRTTARREADWVVVTLWATEESAMVFEEVVEGDPVWAEFIEAVAPESFSSHRFDTLD